MLVAAMRVGVRDGAAALGEGETLTGVCAQERVTRIRGGPTPGGVPDQALDLLLQRAGRSRADIRRLDVVGGDAAPIEGGDANLSDHLGHACTAYWTSPFAEAVVVVCDRDPPGVSAWIGRGSSLTRLDLPWDGPGFAETVLRVFARCGLRRRNRRTAVRGSRPAPPGCARPRLRTTGLARWERARHRPVARTNHRGRAAAGPRSRRSSSSVAGRCPSGASGRSPRSSSSRGCAMAWGSMRSAWAAASSTTRPSTPGFAWPGRFAMSSCRSIQGDAGLPAGLILRALGAAPGTGLAVPRPVGTRRKKPRRCWTTASCITHGRPTAIASRLPSRRCRRAGWSAGSTMRWSGDRGRSARAAFWRARVRPTCSRT